MGMTMARRSHFSGLKSLPGHDLNFEIADDIKEQFNELNSKGIDVNELLREMLKQRQEKNCRGKRRDRKNNSTDDLALYFNQNPGSS